MTDLAVAVTALIDEAKPQFLAVSVDKSVTFEREAKFALQTVMANDYTRKVAMSNPQSLINAVSNISAIGISLNPARRQAYLVPREGKICLDIGYIGLLDIAIEGGSIRWGQAELVHKADRFVMHGVDQQPTHERDPFLQDRGGVVGVYVVVKTVDGDFLTTTMTAAECLAIRDRSMAWKKGEQGKRGPWETDPGEMMKKTVIKRAYKTWPKSQSGKLERAVQHLNQDNEEGLEELRDVEPRNADPLDQPRYLGLSVQKAKEIRKACGLALERWNLDDGPGAYGHLEQYEDDQDTLQAVWTALNRFSDLRAYIKEASKAKRERQAEVDAAIAKMPKQEPTSEQDVQP